MIKKVIRDIIYKNIRNNGGSLDAVRDDKSSYV